MRMQELGSVAGGLIGGVLSTAMMQKGMALTARMPEAMRPPPMRQDPGDFLVGKYEEHRGRRLPQPAHQKAARSLHWIYGIGWASALALFGPRLKMHDLGRATALGAALGAGVWAVGFLGWLPSFGLVAPVRKQGLSHHASALITHVGYGVVAALPIYLGNRLFARRR